MQYIIFVQGFSEMKVTFDDVGIDSLDFEMAFELELETVSMCPENSLDELLDFTKQSLIHLNR